MAELFDLSRDERTGPALHLASLVRDRVWREEIDRPVAPDLVPSRDPIESIDEYLAGVDRDGLARPNVVIVLIESLRADQLRAGGSRRTVMPTVESIAASGRFYSRHWAQASHSNYADLAPLSSQYPLRGERTHVYPRDPPYPRVLIYDVLKGLGYATAIVSSQNETWGGMLNFLDTGNLDAVLHSENFDGPTYVPRHDKGFESYVQGTKRSGKIDDRFTVDRAIKWIDGVGDKPFFLYLNLQSSHLPYETPADFPRRFGPEEIDFTIRFNNFPRDKADVVKDVYANALAYVDFQLGRLVGHLKRTGRWDDTLVVVSGDTGQAFYEHGFSGHANQLYDELVRVPLVIRAPGLSPGVDPHPAQQVDVPPTLLDLLGLPPHPGFQGHSLVAPDAEPDPPLFLVAQAPLAHEYALVRWPYKYVWDVRRQYGVLFDLARDPGETEDRSVRQAEVAARMGAELETWRRAQIDYYRDPALYSRWYPPRLLRVN
jgi:arylsulfatase A-like enzyme